MDEKGHLVHRINSLKSLLGLYGWMLLFILAAIMVSTMAYWLSLLASCSGSTSTRVFGFWPNSKTETSLLIMTSACSCPTELTFMLVHMLPSEFEIQLLKQICTSKQGNSRISSKSIDESLNRPSIESHGHFPMGRCLKLNSLDRWLEWSIHSVFGVLEWRRWRIRQDNAYRR